MTGNSEPHIAVPGDRLWRACVTLLYSLLLLVAVVNFVTGLITRGCAEAGSCSAAQLVAVLIALFLCVTGTLLIGVLGWIGRLPGTRVVDKPVGLMRSSVTAAVVLTFVTGGFYVPFWFQRRMTAINSLDSPAKLWARGPAVVLMLQMLNVVVVAGDTLVSLIVRTAATVAVLMLSFRVRSILTDHSAAKLARVLPPTVHLDSIDAPSPLLTFFFNIWYLQYKMNTLVDES